MRKHVFPYVMASLSPLSSESELESESLTLLLDDGTSSTSSTPGNADTSTLSDVFAPRVEITSAALLFFGRGYKVCFLTAPTAVWQFLLYTPVSSHYKCSVTLVK